MSQFVLKDRSLIDAATFDIDSRKAATEARQEFADKVGATGFKVVMAGQESPKGVDVQAVTVLKFDKAVPADFYAIGNSKDGQALAVPDVRTERGARLAKEMEDFPAFSNQLSRAMGLGTKIENGRVSFGVAGIEEIGRDVVVKTTREPKSGLGVDALSAGDYSEMKAGQERVAKMVRGNAPTPFGA